MVNDDDMAAGAPQGDTEFVDCVEAIHTLYHFLDGQLIGIGGVRAVAFIAAA